MNLREAITFTISHGDLKHSPLVETGADRMGALGHSDPLGAAVWRVTDDHDAHALIAASVLLAKRIRRGRESLPLLTRLCMAVLVEWLADKCRSCGGIGYVIAQAQVKRACTVCRGEGVRRHSDAERCRAMGFDRKIYQRWESRFAAAHAALADANDRVQRDCRWQLERGRFA